MSYCTCDHFLAVSLPEWTVKEFTEQIEGSEHPERGAQYYAGRTRSAVDSQSAPVYQAVLKYIFSEYLWLFCRLFVSVWSLRRRFSQSLWVSDFEWLRRFGPRDGAPGVVGSNVCRPERFALTWPPRMPANVPHGIDEYQKR